MLYLPNIYSPEKVHETKHKKEDNIIDLACFGAIRPMKNQLQQAIAAVAFGNELNKKVRFHINANRLEQHGDPVLKNIRNVFHHNRHELVEHPWLTHDEFIPLVRLMDLGLQVSFSETFNIVAADFVWNDVPIVGSKEISWLHPLYQSNANDVSEMIKKLWLAYKGKKLNLHYLNKIGLNNYNDLAVKKWLHEIYALDFLEQE
jgi:hypothetical protein